MVNCKALVAKGEQYSVNNSLKWGWGGWLVGGADLVHLQGYRFTCHVAISIKYYLLKCFALKLPSSFSWTVIL